MASKQDANGVRNAQDLEKKYDFAGLLGLKKNVEYAQKSILQINNEINNILSEIDADIYLSSLKIKNCGIIIT